MSRRTRGNVLRKKCGKRYPGGLGGALLGVAPRGRRLQFDGGLPWHSPSSRSLSLTRDRDAGFPEAALGLVAALPHPLELGFERRDAPLQLQQTPRAPVLAPTAAFGGRSVLVAADAPEQLLRVDAEGTRQRD